MSTCSYFGSKTNMGQEHNKTNPSDQSLAILTDHLQKFLLQKHVLLDGFPNEIKTKIMALVQFPMSPTKRKSIPVTVRYLILVLISIGNPPIIIVQVI